MADAPLPPDFINGVKESAPGIQPDDSASQHSETAHDFINSQLQLEADAREVLPYAFDHCTQPLGPLKQDLFACLTCNPPESPNFESAAVCYSCSIACHGEHALVELFSRRNFTCDCGTTRIPETSACTLRINPATGMKGAVHSEKAADGNTYNQNCRNRFCGCGELYDAQRERGTMFQCLGLAQEKDGGCGEDWWHAECVLGLGRDWAKKVVTEPKQEINGDTAVANGEDPEAEDHPLPPGFPDEDDFEAFLCYKCVDANPWIKQYAGTEGFLPAVYHIDTKTQDGHAHASQPEAKSSNPDTCPDAATSSTTTTSTQPPPTYPSSPRKRTASTASLDPPSEATTFKTPKLDPPSILASQPPLDDPAYHASLPPIPASHPPFSLFLRADFRDHLCRCKTCYPTLRLHPQLLEEEETFEPPLSTCSGDSNDGNGSAAEGGSAGQGGSQRSLLERGEAALSNVDRVRAIEGVMVYNHLKDKVKSFLQPFAESGQAVGAEDIKAYFEKLRGDEQGIRAAAEGVGNSGEGGGGGGGGKGDGRREQGGY